MAAVRVPPCIPPVPPAAVRLREPCVLPRHVLPRILPLPAAAACTVAADECVKREDAQGCSVSRFAEAFADRAGQGLLTFDGVLVYTSNQ